MRSICLVKKVALLGCIFDKYALQSRAVTRPVIAFQLHRREKNKSMKMTKKNMGIGVAVIAALVILWSVLKPAPAEAAEVGFTLGAERKIEAETNAMYLDTNFGEVLGIDVTTGVNYTVDDDMDASFDSFELDLKKGLNDMVEVYANSDFDVNLDHTETTIGFKVKF